MYLLMRCVVPRGSFLHPFLFTKDTTRHRRRRHRRHHCFGDTTHATVRPEHGYGKKTSNNNLQSLRFLCLACL